MFGDILIGAVVAEDLALLVAVDVNVDRNVADAAIGIPDAMDEVAVVMSIGGVERAFDLRTDDGQVVGIDEGAGVLR